MTVSDLWVLMSLFRSVILLPLIGNRQTLKQSSTKNNIKTVKPKHNNHKNINSLIHQIIRHSPAVKMAACSRSKQKACLVSVNTADFVFALHFILFYFFSVFWFWFTLKRVVSAPCVFMCWIIKANRKQPKQSVWSPSSMRDFIFWFSIKSARNTLWLADYWM